MGTARKTNYDLLRILAAFSVVMLHCAAQSWYYVPVDSMEWKVAEIYDGMFRFGVPIFVMLSGGIFLNRIIEIKRLYFHNILHIFIVYFVWTLGYGLFELRHTDITSYGWVELIKQVLMGRYHLWFLPMIMGLYILIPVFKLIVDSKNRIVLRYIIMVFMICKILPFSILAINDGFLTTYMSQFLATTDLPDMLGYSGYFILGYYLSAYGLPVRIKKILYMLFFPCMILNVVVDMIMSISRNSPQGIIYDSFGIFTFIISVAIFVFFDEEISKINFSGKTSYIIKIISECTLGIYILHVGLLEYLAGHNITNMSIPNVIGIPALAVCSFMICFVLSFLIRKIPVIGKRVL